MVLTDWSWSEAYPAPTMFQTPLPAPYTLQQSDKTMQSVAFPNQDQSASRSMYNPDEPPSASQASQTTFEPSAAAFPFASTNTTAIPDSFRYRASSSGYRTPSSSISSVSRPTAGRKRSADEISIDETPRFPDAAGIAAVRRARGENVDGVGIDVDVDVAGQTGSWAEELAERMRRSYVTEENSGTVLVPRKSQRMNGDASGMDHGAPALRRQSVEEPIIDIATRTLGIGWTSLTEDDSMQGAARGWARFIERSYPLQSVRFIWRSRSLPAHLVEAVTVPTPGVSGYYLFDDTLSQGRLVARSWERALDNLRGVPMQFDGIETLQLRGAASESHGRLVTSRIEDEEMVMG